MNGVAFVGGAKSLKDTELISSALRLSTPWKVTGVAFKQSLGRLEVSVDFERGGTFCCPQCGRPGIKAYDTEERRWRHLNFFENQTLITARVPRVDCSVCGVKMVSAPWARANSGFTLLMDSLIMRLAPDMAVSKIASYLDEHDGMLWRVINRYVAEAVEREDFSSLTRIGIDETAVRRGHKYITVVTDMEQRRVVHVGEGKDAGAVLAFSERLESQGGGSENIREVCCDMSAAYLSAVDEAFASARVTLDRFHVARLVSCAVDEIRRLESRERVELKGSRMLWLKGIGKLSEPERARLDKLSRMNLKTGRAYRMWLSFRGLYEVEAQEAEGYLLRWLNWASRSRLEPMVRVAQTLRKHFDGVLRWFTTRISNGVVEGINGMIQTAKARARGYRSLRNLTTMVYLIAGKLKFDLPT